MALQISKESFSVESFFGIERSIKIINIDRIVCGRIRIVSLEVIATKTSDEVRSNLTKSAQITSKICGDNAGFCRKRRDCALRSDDRFKAVLIDEGVPQGDRLVRLNQIAINQMRVLENDDNRNLLK